MNKMTAKLDTTHLRLNSSPAANIGFPAKLGDEYILIVSFAYHLQSGPNEQSQATE